MTATEISDDVWRQLDRNAGRMSRRGFLLFLTACLALPAVAYGGLVAWRTVAHPLVAADDFLSYSATAGQHKVFSLQVKVRNQGITALTVVSAGQDGPGLHLVAPVLAVEHHLAVGQELLLVLEYEVTDCSAVPAGTWPVPIVVDQPWGRRTVEVRPQTMPDPADTNGAFTAADEVQWQTAMAYQSCRSPSA
ncbi:hypothetical protein [Hamadaea tsunoensis]|uniref:hypothetical protein n=1 Tax=Hamadaea tsunoensis TaxID=53368 RepID=UPI0004821EDB|nr:hypothetical protein [Hamadaea tsunoensis]